MKRVYFFLLAGLIMIGCQSKQNQNTEEAEVKEHPEVVAENVSSLIDVNALKAKMDANEEILLLDVRHPDEIASGTIPGNKVFAEYGEEGFEEALAELDKDKTYYVYCHAGMRAGNTQQIMQDMGFKEVINVEGGISGWMAAGYEVEGIE